jgi:hypothetical protein
VTQEEKVQCIYCGAVTEPIAEECAKHVMNCEKHPTGIAMRFLRRIARGEDKPTELANHALFVITGGHEGYINTRFL